MKKIKRERVDWEIYATYGKNTCAIRGFVVVSLPEEKEVNAEELSSKWSGVFASINETLQELGYDLKCEVAYGYAPHQKIVREMATNLGEEFEIGDFLGYGVASAKLLPENNKTGVQEEFLF